MCALGGDREDPAGHLPRFGLRGKARVLDSEDFAPANGRAKQLRKAACEVSVTFAHTFSVCDFRMWRLLNIHSGVNECGSTKICGLMHLTKVYLSSGEKAIMLYVLSHSVTLSFPEFHATLQVITGTRATHIRDNYVSSMRKRTTVSPSRQSCHYTSDNALVFWKVEHYSLNAGCVYSLYMCMFYIQKLLYIESSKVGK